MSKYTTELRWVVEQTLDDLDLAHEEANWPKCWKVLGLDDYPLFDEAHRDELNSKIVRHYYTREIAAETVGRWRLFVRDAMHLIMPYYNQLYESELAAAGIDPLTDRGMTTTEHGEGKGSADTSQSATGQDVYSDTPQSEMIPAQIKEMRYATSVNLTEGSTTGEQESEYANDLERKETGYSKSQSNLLSEWRETFLNIDQMVVDDIELRQCFLTVW